MILFLKLLIAHLLGDFVFQPKSWVKDRKKKKIKSLKLYAHIGVHALLLFLLLEFNIKYIGGILLIIVSHFLIDLGKVYLQKKNTKRILFFVDQALHLLFIGFAFLLYESAAFNFSEVMNQQNLLLIACLIFVTYTSSIIINTIISKWNPVKEKKSEEQSLANAGKYIGFLERLLIFVFIAINQWAGVGFLLAAKSIFRFGDLTASKDRKLTEYVLIGTLLSFGLAILTGLVYSHYGR
ncbi:DUF3307 domain-containing protein [Tenacibaculum sp. S7007]|uniref:DUF3307 domain-containing protein n=1 Tax=Tenacibaculum pelagium TaxID=2759527 RepID=A0A839ARS2_9FLAO|nr:DUF3307 domain-containing protein [Tenacibaculum pelagium]MBA6157038.1 DUF3307 domain-containing protein [Tenacibaculum pelagium]